MQTKTNANYNFSNLSIKDLIEARDTFHAHLINKRNVVATAIGRYLIREEDIDKDGRYKPLHKGTRRTIENSCVIEISWPCILVFVTKWQSDKELIEKGASDIVPKSVFMPDGRIIPICVVEAPQKKTGSNLVNFDKLIFPTNLVGGGFPVIVNVQGNEHVATIACLVTDGHTDFALTNKHVTGDETEEIKTFFGNKPETIGYSSGLSISKADFSKWYPEWAVKSMRVNCDVGLIKVSDVNRWKTAILDIGELDELYDLNTFNLDLSLISAHEFQPGEKKAKKLPAENGKVRGYGAISHVTEGQILALFYRYKSVGGMEYVSDFLIGGRNGATLKVDYGDSGMLWLLETKDEDDQPKLQPFALHWGQHQFFVDQEKNHFSYSLSTALSNICRELDVELVRGCNILSDYSWGKVGHYTVGSLAIDCMEGNGVTLVKANINNISFQSRKITKDLAKKDNPDLSKNPDEGFCPLADVPDIIWKQSKPYVDKEGNSKGFEWGRKGDENPNHYADADFVVNGKKLYDFCPTAADLTTKNWEQYYDEVDQAMGKPANDQAKSKRGLLCFRVWQIFDYMKAALEANEHDKFIFAAGVLAHYIGDACQPLHSSYMSDGDPADTTTEMYTPPRGGSRHPKGVPYLKENNPGSGVHVAYEDNMIDDYIHEMLPKIKEMIADKTSKIMEEEIVEIRNGQEAGFAILNLMKLTQEDISPKSIVESFKKAKAAKKDISQELYNEFGDLTIQVLARGCRYLAAVWDAAWKESKTETKYKSEISQDALIALYRMPTELPSYHLDTFEEK